jgi:hypothetical protein
MRADTRGAIYGVDAKVACGRAGAAPEPRFAVELEEDLQVSGAGADWRGDGEHVEHTAVGGAAGGAGAGAGWVGGAGAGGDAA